MSAQGGVADEERFVIVMAQYHVTQCLEGNFIAHAPFCSGLLVNGVVLLPIEPLETRTNQIAFHICEVDVTSIQILCVIAFFLQRTRNAGDMPYLSCHLHHRHSGKRQITAQCTYRTTIGAIAVAETVCEVDSLVSSLIEVRHHSLEHFSTALQQDDYHVGALSRQQCVASQAFTVIEPFGELCHLFWSVKMICRILGGCFLKRREKTEHRVYGRMVQKLVLREIYLSDVGC